MYIKSLLLKNFQKHENLFIKFVNGVNVIVGQSDVGKSTIVRAIRWLAFNDIKSDIVRKEGSKVTEVTLVLDNDTSITRIKSNTVNSYVLKVKDQSEITFDSIGKNIPEEIKKVLQLTTIEVDNEEINLNVAHQLSMPFLLDKSATFRTKLFNKLTGNHIIDKVLQSFNKDLLHISKEEKIHAEHIETHKKELEQLDSKLKNIQELKHQVELNNQKINELFDKYSKLKKYYNDFVSLNMSLQQIKEKLSIIKIVEQNKIDAIKEAVTKLDKYKILLTNIKENIKNLNDYTNKTTLVPSFDFYILNQKLEKLIHYKEYKNRLYELSQKRSLLTENLLDLEITIEKKTEKYKLMLKELKICPTCKKNLTIDDIKEINL